MTVLTPDPKFEIGDRVTTPGGTGHITMRWNLPGKADADPNRWAYRLDDGRVGDWLEHHVEPGTAVDRLGDLIR